MLYPTELRAHDESKESKSYFRTNRNVRNNFRKDRNVRNLVR